MRTSVMHPVERPPGRRVRDALLVAGLLIVLLFAIVGVVTAGAMLAKMGGSKASSNNRTTSNANLAGAQRPTNARATASAIIQSAQANSQKIVASAKTKANAQAKRIIASAKRQAAAQPAAPAATPLPASAAGAAGPVAASQSGKLFQPQSSTYQLGTQQTGRLAPIAGQTGAIDLRSLPASWLVAGYNATFGNGPGSAGGITVVNRSHTTFSGVAKVVYASGGSAQAHFVGLAPGQTEVLPLNGPAYAGGAYRIVVSPR